MSKLKVKTEFLPTRCEVCHQADKFDPYLEICLRCVKIGSNEQNLKATEKDFNKQPKMFGMLCLSTFGSVLGTIIGFFVAMYVNANEWEIENKAILTYWICIIIGQIGFPSMLNTNLRLISKLFLWSVVGLLSSIFGVLVCNVITILFLERTFDICLAEPIWFIKVRIIWALILGVNMGPLIGFLTEKCFNKARNRKLVFVTKG